MTTSVEYLESLIHQANYLRNLIEDGKIPGTISDVVADGCQEADSFMDDLCSMVNEERA